MALLAEPKKILIILHGSVGDVVRAMPLASLVRRGFPSAYLAWAVEPACYALLENFTAVDEVILFDRRDWLRGTWPFLKKIRARGFDLVLDLQRHLKSGLISRFSAAPWRLGFHRADAKECNWLFNNRHIEAAGADIPKFDHYLKFAEYLGIPTKPVQWDIHLTPQDKLAVKKHLAALPAEFSGFFVGARWQSKRWSPSQMASLAIVLQERYGLSVVLLGGKEDMAIADEIPAAGHIANLVGRTSLREAAGIIERAQFCVGPDTGLMHLAAAVGTPVISLWGATDPRRTGPYGFDSLVIRGRASCSPCNKKNCSIGRVCMQSITTDEIVKKVDAALAAGRPMRDVRVEYR
jgi:lipopolysaccharide heptosyltransferase I